MNDLPSNLHASTHTSGYLGVILLHMQNFIWHVNRMPTLQQACSVILLQIIHLQLDVKFSFHLQKSIVLYSIWKRMHQCEQLTKTVLSWNSFKIWNLFNFATSAGKYWYQNRYNFLRKKDMGIKFSEFFHPNELKP